MHDDEDKAGELFEEVERRAYLDLPAEEPEEELDVLGTLQETGPEVDATAGDLTLGGYIDLHNRPPAFTGNDNQPYTVGVDVEETGDAGRPYAAFLVFIRWAETGAGIMQHVESDDVAWGDSAESASAAALELTLYEVKAELDAAIARKIRMMEE